MRLPSLIFAGILSLILLSGCSNREAAQLGSMIGRALGKPVGTVATALDETVRTTADIVKDNPRYQRQAKPERLAMTPRIDQRQDDYYYRAEVLVKTRGPAQIEEFSLQQTEDVSDFWR